MTSYHDHTDTIYEHTPEVEQVQVTRVRFHRGIGCCDKSVVRIVTAWYEDGRKIAEFDPTKDEWAGSLTTLSSGAR